MRASTILLLLTLVVPMSSCASTGGGSGSSNGGNPDVITLEEIESGDFGNQNAYRLISRLRPSWLRSRGGGGFTGDRPLPVAFVEGTRYGEVEALRSISASDVAEMEFLDSRDATTRFGTGYIGGAILVTLK